MFKSIIMAHQGKLVDKWSCYLPVYERIVVSHAGRPLRILEIGVQNGGSLEVWALSCPNATHVVGCDIDTRCGQLHFDDPRITIVVGDAGTDETEANVAAVSQQFDLIIDDGSHVSGDIVKSFARYFPRLADGGTYVAEDLHCSYWADFQGGLFRPGASMSFFKRLADVINHEHWGLLGGRRKLLASFAREFGVSFDEASLTHIHSVQFLNSMCVIEKRVPADNALGPRICSGGMASVEPKIADLGGMQSPVHDEAANPWSALESLPEDELTQLREAKERFDRSEAVAREAQTAVRQLTASRNDLRGQLKEAEQRLALSEARIHAMQTTMSWRFAALLRPLERPRSNIARIRRRLSSVRKHEGGVSKMLCKCLAVLCESGPTGVRHYLKHTEAVAADPGQTGVRHYPKPAVATAVDKDGIARRVFQDQQTEFTREDLANRIKQFQHRPLISIIMPVYDTPVQWLARVIESLQEQVYENWELCAVDDCSLSNDQRRVLEASAKTDPRIRYHFAAQNGGISASSNTALEMARGQYIALVDHDDELTLDAFYWIVKTLNGTPDADFLYSDECKIDDTEQRRLFHFIFKPQWSPEIMFNGMVTGHLTVYRTELVRQLGGFRTEYDFSQDYDLALRVAEKARKVVHIERVLYLWRAIHGSAASGGKGFARQTNLAALAGALARRGIEGTTRALAHCNYVEVALPPGIRVSIVIPSDSYENLTLAIDSILNKTSFPDYEVVAVCNGPLADRLARERTDWRSVVFSRYDKVYNFSDKCNQGARDASGDVLVFYNDDVSPIEPDWIDRLIEYLEVPGVGGVSPKLLREDGTIQYAGIISGTPGLCGTAYNNVHRDAHDEFLTMHRYVRNVSILSGACCAIKKALFWQVGGFDAVNTPDGHSDIVLSCKILKEGYRLVYTPHAELSHIGHGSWNVKKGKYKADIFVLKHWGSYVSEDPYFTHTMRRVLYDDFRFGYKIYASHIDPTRTYSGPDVLFVSHELSQTGAPRMLFYAAKAVLARGGFPVVVAPMDGPIRRELVEAGIVVIVDESVTCNHFLFGAFAKNFDTVVVNTFVLDSVIRQLAKFEDLKVIWWLHEAQALGKTLAKLGDVDIGHPRVLCTSEYAKGYVPAWLNADFLYNGVPDLQSDVPTVARGKAFTFMISGTIEPRKGQDIFAEAILLLPEAVRRDCRFVFSGKLWQQHEPFWSNILNRMKQVSQLEYVGLLDHEEALEHTLACDVVVCCSRDEPFSLTAIEGAMLGKPAILSSYVGVAEVLKQNASCLVFESGNAKALAAQLLYAFQHADEMKAMGQNARLVYEREFTVERFSERLLELIGERKDLTATSSMT